MLLKIYTIFITTLDQNWGCFQVNVGCVPKKLMYYAAEANDHVEDLKDFGFQGIEKKPFEWG